MFRQLYIFSISYLCSSLSHTLLLSIIPPFFNLSNIVTQALSKASQLPLTLVPATLPHEPQLARQHATEELHGTCPNVRVKISDVEIDQHFFVQVILGEPYITTAPMETKVLDNGSTYARVKSQDGRHSVQFLTVRPNRERNR